MGTLASPPAGWGRHSRDQDEGDASVPTPRLIPYKYRFFAGPASQAEGEHALDMCSNAFSGGFRGSLSKKPILVRLCWRMTHRMELGLMIAKTRPIWRPFDLHLRPISTRFNQECHSPTKSFRGRFFGGQIVTFVDTVFNVKGVKPWFSRDR